MKTNNLTKLERIGLRTLMRCSPLGFKKKGTGLRPLPSPPQLRGRRAAKRHLIRLGNMVESALADRKRLVPCKEKECSE